MVSKTVQSGKSEANESLSDLLSQQKPQDVQKLMATLAAATQESQGLLADIMQMGASNPSQPQHDPVELAQSFMRVGQSLAMNPMHLMQANMDLWQGLMTTWTDVMMGRPGTANGHDRRFSDPEWSTNPIFDAMRRSYELNTKWMMSLIDGASGLPVADKRKARFYAQQTIDAFAPTNFFATNPQVLKTMLKTGGSSVLEGLKQARADVQSSSDRLAISQTDEAPFVLGENVATAPGKVVFRNDLIELIQYEPTTETVYRRPLLIFPPWINKFYILDLREENSMIRWLRDKGITVFVVSWRSADEVTKNYKWDDYVEQGIYAAVGAATKAADVKNINTVGYCIGGTLLTSALALMAQEGDKRIRSATFFASQMDFELAGDLLIFTDEDSVERIDQIIDKNKGIMPGEVMGETFNWLRPVDLVWRYVVDNYMLGKKPKPFDLLYWNADQTNIPARTHKTYIKKLYARNALSRGNFKVLGTRVDVQDIEIPVFVQASRDDHICPYQSVYRTSQAFSGPSTFCLAGSGHIAGVVNHPDAKKYQHWINPELAPTADEWIEGAEERPGSWWPTWLTWLRKQSGKRIDARMPEDVGLGDAPGTYVKRRLKDIREERGLLD
ncbi:MAG: class I poly(R)-hydroxyalkanoic acid synthase [Pseudomonadota bacterium]